MADRFTLVMAAMIALTLVDLSYADESSAAETLPDTLGRRP
jgi:hypothetical protein